MCIRDRSNHILDLVRIDLEGRNFWCMFLEGRPRCRDTFKHLAEDIGTALASLFKMCIRDSHIITHDKIRPDGRALDEVRPISCEVGLLARPHGCSLFTRGQTQVLNCLALAPLREAQTLDGLGTELTKRYKMCIRDRIPIMHLIFLL